MNVFAKFDEIPSMILEVIKVTKRYGQTVVRTDNVKTVYPPTNTVCGGYNYKLTYEPLAQVTKKSGGMGAIFEPNTLSS